ncbi:MAG: hypothetical protein Q8P31_01665 [Bacillota bacterium]|nr:hypothetical protein [Bacillota bacterium]
MARGHSITLFNRGVTRTDPVPGVENLRGDRDGGLGALGERWWDAVIDTSGYFPRIVGAVPGGSGGAPSLCLQDIRLCRLLGTWPG